MALRKHKLALISAVIVGLFYLVAMFADLLAYAPPFDTEAAPQLYPAATDPLVRRQRQFPPACLSR